MIKTNLSSSNSAGALSGTTDGLARLTRALYTNVFHSQAALTRCRLSEIYRKFIGNLCEIY